MTTIRKSKTKHHRRLHQKPAEPVRQGRSLQPRRRAGERSGGEYRNPGRCEPGSIEQQLDMCEDGPLRGDEITYTHGLAEREDLEELKPVDVPMKPLDQLTERYSVDMSELNREGDEMSGDDHSLGLQGDESELASQPHIHSGVPGDEDREQAEETESRERKRIP